MTRKGAQLLAASLVDRMWEIQEIRGRLDKEEERLLKRLSELEEVQDPVPGVPVILVE